MTLSSPQAAIFGMGCFWGAEKRFSSLPGIFSTTVGYAGGHTEHPSYKQVCKGNTGHAEVVQIIYDPAKISYTTLLTIFFENHDPTQKNHQGADYGTQYRSLIIATSSEQREDSLAAIVKYQDQLAASSVHRPIVTEILSSAEFYPAEEEHQQYLLKNPQGYCGEGGTGVSCSL